MITRVRPFPLLLTALLLTPILVEARHAAARIGWTAPTIGRRQPLGRQVIVKFDYLLQR